MENFDILYYECKDGYPPIPAGDFQKIIEGYTKYTNRKIIALPSFATLERDCSLDDLYRIKTWVSLLIHNYLYDELEKARENRVGNKKVDKENKI